MNPPRDRVDQVLDIVLFAPIGALLNVGELVGNLAKRGRHEAGQATGVLRGLRCGFNRSGGSTSGRPDR